MSSYTFIKTVGVHWQPFEHILRDICPKYSGHISGIEPPSGTMNISTSSGLTDYEFIVMTSFVLNFDSLNQSYALQFNDPADAHNFNDNIYENFSKALTLSPHNVLYDTQYPSTIFSSVVLTDDQKNSLQQVIGNYDPTVTYVSNAANTSSPIVVNKLIGPYWQPFEHILRILCPKYSGYIGGLDTESMEIGVTQDLTADELSVMRNYVLNFDNFKESYQMNFSDPSDHNNFNNYLYLRFSNTLNLTPHNLLYDTQYPSTIFTSTSLNDDDKTNLQNVIDAYDATQTYSTAIKPTNNQNTDSPLNTGTTTPSGAQISSTAASLIKYLSLFSVDQSGNVTFNGRLILTSEGKIPASLIDQSC